MIKTAQPRLYDYYFNLRRKKSIRNLLEPYGGRACLHVSGMYPREQFCSAPVVSLCRHPTNSNSIIVADLSQDIEPLLSWSDDQIREKLFVPGRIPDRPPLKEIKINRCPFIAGIEVLDEENWSRIGFKRKDIERRMRRLKQPGLAQKIARVYAGRALGNPDDPDAALYNAFVQEADRSRSVAFLEAVRAGGWQDMDFQDKRLHVLASRLKARSFPERLSPQERGDWQAFVASKLHASSADWLTLSDYLRQIRETRSILADEPATGRDLALLDELLAHGERLAERYPAAAAE
jgi:exodeoxyribonuclease-1